MAGMQRETPTADSRMSQHFHVVGAGTQQSNGIYRRLEEQHLDFPVFGSSGGYRLSLSQNPEAGTGRLQWGWILGRAGMPAYACPTEDHARVPESAWQCFMGTLPAPKVLPLDEGKPADLLGALAEEAQSAATRGDWQRAKHVYSWALEKARQPVCRADWARRAALCAQRARVHEALGQFDHCLADADAALELQPDLVPALLLRSRVLQETREWREAALSGKACWLLMHSTEEAEKEEEGPNVLRRSFLRKGAHESVRAACRGLLRELGEEPDGSLPKRYRQSKELSELLLALGDLGSKGTQNVFSIQVTGSGAAACNGTYYDHSRRRGETREGRAAVFESDAGFRISLEVLPARSTGQAMHIWVLGKDKVGYYGAPATGVSDSTSQSEAATVSRLPPADGWRSFGAGGPPPAPRCVAQYSGGEGRDTQACSESWSTVEAAMRRAAAPACVKERASSLTQLARSLRSAGELEVARACVDEALALWPGATEAYLERARASEAAGEAAAAVTPLLQLLTAWPSHEGAWGLLLDLASRHALPEEVGEWLNEHAAKRHAAPAPSEGIAAASDPADGAGGTLEHWRGEAPNTFEDRCSEVYTQWSLPSGVTAQDVTVAFEVCRLTIVVADEVLFDSSLAHRIRPSESSWTFAAPDLSLQLSKAMSAGGWPKWETLRPEAPGERRARLGGLPFDDAKTQYVF